MLHHGLALAAAEHEQHKYSALWYTRQKLHRGFDEQLIASLSQWLRGYVPLRNPATGGVEDFLYEIESMRRFSRLRLSERIPGETPILSFRNFLEDGERDKKLFKEINVYLGDHDLVLHEGGGTWMQASLLRRAGLDERCRQEARPGDASSQEDQPLTLLHEGASRS